eukprot:301237-Rhodomonas_salina.1
MPELIPSSSSSSGRSTPARNVVNGSDKQCEIEYYDFERLQDENQAEPVGLDNFQEVMEYWLKFINPIHCYTQARSESRLGSAYSLNTVQEPDLVLEQDMEIFPDQMNEQRFSPSCSRISEDSCELQLDLEMDARNGENEQPATEQAM